MSLGADTHTLDMNQHFVPLSFTVGTGSLNVTLPASASVAPPGSYMLFIVNGNGVPSVAPFLRLVPSAATPPTVSITAPTSGQQVSGTSVPLTATGSSDVTSVQFTVDGAPVGAKVTSPPYSVRWDTTGVTNGTHTITATATNAAGVSAGAAPVTVTVNNVSSGGATVDAQTSKDGRGTLTTSAFSTAQAGDVLVAFATSHGPGSSAQTMTVSGAGLSWTLVKRVNAQKGTTEIWTAKAAGALTNATVTSTPVKSGYDQSLTVVAFAGSGGLGASAAASAANGAPTVSLTTTRANSLVYGAGNDYDNAVARVAGAGQALVHQWVDTAVGDTFWTQYRTLPVAGRDDDDDQRHVTDRGPLEPGGRGDPVELGARALRPGALEVAAIDLVRRAVLHDACDLRDEVLVVAGPAEQVEPHLHARRDAARGDDAAGVDHAGAADAAGGRDLREAVDRDLARRAGLDPVGLLAVGGRQAVEQRPCAP